MGGPAEEPAPAFTVTPVTGLPEITAGADLAGLIAGAVPDLRAGDILVVTSKIVSKAEGRVVTASREQAIEAETVRVVAEAWRHHHRADAARPGPGGGRRGRVEHQPGDRGAAPRGSR